MDALANIPSFIHVPARPPAAGSPANTPDAPDALDTKGRDPRLWATAQDFEAQFTSTLFQSMFEGLDDDNPFGGGPGETMFRSLLVDQYSQQTVKTGGIGIADNVYREMLKMQEAPAK
ncbi:MAG: chemotaxis protein chel [Alphaproteobacteria bacterium HGW-Alphaproteobacteria-12]|nr:MAG: chemotaxis protein chel [Alphaproteobacteria bacterium HGW-Alphaproteobacteria-12]